MRILLVEDETGIADLIREGLEEANFTVDVARDGETGLSMALAQPYHLILLDVMLPRRNGWSVCAELRGRRYRTPILMLTARDAVKDRVRGLDVGADDYLPKPFDFLELKARIHALLRREREQRTKAIRVADLEIDTVQHRVKRGGVEINLSPREYDLLEALATHEGKVLTREAIQERVWMNEEAGYNIVNVYVRLLRKKIDSDYPVKLIQTIHGAGYTLCRPLEEMP
jgi:two-component system copper resistance phosphate regulon response regulator CusR